MPEHSLLLILVPSSGGDIPATAILTEDGFELQTEDGQDLLTE